MEKKRIVIIIGLCFALVVLFFLMIKNTFPGKPTVSPNILALSQPIYSISGSIEKIDNQAIYVTDQTSKLKFKVNTSKNTSFVRSPVTIPYLFLTNNNTNIPTRMSFEDLKVKDAVYISSKQDLRTVVKNEFEALVISKNAGSSSVSGVITEIGSGILRIKTTGKTYRVDVPSICEISTATPLPTRFFFSDLKMGGKIVAYTEDDVNQTTDITALRIEPIGEIIINQPTPSIPQLTPTVSPPITSITPTTSTTSSVSATPLGSPSSILKTR